MIKVFEPGEIELADSRGDPNRVVEIQKKVKELLETNQQRQEGLREELLEEGAWALPGLINSTYVWMNQLEKDEISRTILSSIMAGIAKNNPAAVNLLFKAGVFENPFDTPRSIAWNALERVGWKPNQDILKAVKVEIARQRKLQNVGAVLDLYKILLWGGGQDALESAIQECKQMLAKNMGSSGQILSMIVRAYPDQIEKILVEIFIYTRDDYKDKNIARMLLEPLRPIPPEWWDGDKVIRIAAQVLENCIPPRHTVIEFLLTDGVYDFKKQDHAKYERLLGQINETVIEHANEMDPDVAQSLLRYWFEALAYSGESKYVIEAALSENEMIALRAAQQLFFGENSRNSKLRSEFAAAREELNFKYPLRYQRAQQEFSDISGKKKVETEIHKTNRQGTLRTRRKED